MPTLQCANCQRAFDVQFAIVGSQAQCPFCSAITTMTPQDVADAGTDGSVSEPSTGDSSLPYDQQLNVQRMRGSESLPGYVEYGSWSGDRSALGAGNLKRSAVHPIRPPSGPMGTRKASSQVRQRPRPAAGRLLILASVLGTVSLVVTLGLLWASANSVLLPALTPKPGAKPATPSPKPAVQSSTPTPAVPPSSSRPGSAATGKPKPVPTSVSATAQVPNTGKPSFERVVVAVRLLGSDDKSEVDRDVSQLLQASAHLLGRGDTV